MKLLKTRPIRTLFSSIDWLLFFLVLSIIGIGVFNLASIANILPKPLHNTQILWFALGFLFFVIPCASIDYRNYSRFGHVIYGGGIVLLVAVLLFGTDFNNSRRWINLGLFHMQPSELMKVALVIFVAKYLSDREHRQNNGLKELLPLFGAILLPMALIFMEPDLGTALLLALISGVMILFEGVKRRTLAVIVAVLIASAPAAWFVMHDYQRSRVLTFLQIEDDPYGSDWQVKNSVIAVGSGGLTGRGYGQSTQVQKGFVPEPENDFALANWAEEYGFVGVFALLALYFMLLMWALHIASTARDRFGMHLAVGVAAIFFWQIVVNTAMVVRWAPVVGITLPLISYRVP